MSESPWDDPQWREYEKHCRETLEPMVSDSAVCMSLVPPTDGVDPKFAVELGYMIMLDKPIIAVVSAGRKVPLKLVKVADEIVEGDIGDPDFEARLKAAIDRVTTRVKPPDKPPPDWPFKGEPQ